MKHIGPIMYCVLCGKPIFSGQEVDKVPLDVPPYRKITAHKDCCVVFWNYGSEQIKLPINQSCEL